MNRAYGFDHLYHPISEKSSCAECSDGKQNTIFAYQFLSPLDNLETSQKDYAIQNGGRVAGVFSEWASYFGEKILPSTFKKKSVQSCYSPKSLQLKNHPLGKPFHGKLSSNQKPYGAHKYLVKDTCFKAGAPNGCRYIQPYREAVANCEAICPPGGSCNVCKEYGDALERYMQCRERCGTQSPVAVERICGKPPVNPKLTNCKRVGFTDGLDRWGPSLARANN